MQTEELNPLQQLGCQKVAFTYNLNSYIYYEQNLQNYTGNVRESLHNQITYMVNR